MHRPTAGQYFADFKFDNALKSKSGRIWQYSNANWMGGLLSLSSTKAASGYLSNTTCKISFRSENLPSANQNGMWIAVLPVLSCIVIKSGNISIIALICLIGKFQDTISSPNKRCSAVLPVLFCFFTVSGICSRIYTIVSVDKSRVKFPSYLWMMLLP